jgi:SAM-dependent methyltransferase
VTAVTDVRGSAGGLRRSYELLRAFRHEQSDPDRFYRLQANDVADLLERWQPLDGARVLDVGGGPGYFTEEFSARGATAFVADASAGELALHARRPDRAVVATGTMLPIPSAVFDVCCSLNVLEHVREPWAVADEMVRVVRPGGLVFVSVTNWYSPWGGHETSPWHYLGGERAVERYRRRHGRPPKNRYGRSLFPIHVSEAMAWARHHRQAMLLEARPRYLPEWCRPIVAVPGLREVATWNLALVLRRV